MGQNFSSPLGAAINAEPMGFSQCTSMPNVAFDKQAWRISPKVDKDLAKFDGKPESYRLWWNRIRDHICAGHQPYGRLLELVEKSRKALSFQRLRDIPDVDGVHLDLVTISKHLWCFLGPRLGQPQL